MGDRNLTLFALHTHGDNQFGPSSISGVGSEDESASEASGRSWFGGGSGENEDEEEAAEIEITESEEAGGGIGGVIVALLVLVGIAMVAKKLTGGSEETEVDVAESDDL